MQRIGIHQHQWVRYEREHRVRHDENSGVIIEGGSVDDTISALVLISLFTDARADESDTLPDQSSDLRGW